MGSVCSNQPVVIESTSDPKKLVTKFSKLTSLKSQFEFISQLGNGAFGKVRLYRDIYYKDMLYAIKTLKKEGIPKLLYKCLIEEVKILSELDHPHIVKYYGTFEDAIYLHIVMEYLKGDSLNKIITLKTYNELSETETCQIIHQLLKALLFIHNKNIVHRDIKPENIVFGKKHDYSTLNLIDFGLATTTQANKKSSVGSPYYMAPEIINGNFSAKTDIWSVGVMIYLMLTGKHPFTAGKDGKEDLFDNILNKPYDVSELDKHEISEEGKDFIIKTLVKDPSKRLSTEECLNHPWVKIYGIRINKNLVNKTTIQILKSFAKKTPLQKELYYFIAKILPEEEIQTYKETFNVIDTMSTGNIYKEEMKKTCQDNNINITDKELIQIWKGLDFHNVGKVNYTEFIAALITEIKFSEEPNKIAALFSFFTGTNEEGNVITFDILLNKAKVLNISLNEKELKGCFEQMKKKGEKLNFEMFKKILK